MSDFALWEAIGDEVELAWVVVLAIAATVADFALLDLDLPPPHPPTAIESSAATIAAAVLCFCLPNIPFLLYWVAQPVSAASV